MTFLWIWGVGGDITERHRHSPTPPHPQHEKETSQAGSCFTTPVISDNRLGNTNNNSKTQLFDIFIQIRHFVFFSGGKSQFSQIVTFLLG